MDNNNSPLEKRRFPRVESALPVQYKNLRGAGESPSGSLTKNLGEGGVCFQSSRFMSLACRLIVEIELPNMPKPIKAISKIAWVRKMSEGDKYELGNQFLEIAKEDKARIVEFVKESLGSST